jgi:hypothetical protein
MPGAVHATDGTHCTKHHALLAQLVEQATLNRQVIGSNPMRRIFFLILGAIDTATECSAGVVSI